MSAPSFREQYEWWINQSSTMGTCLPEEIISLYAEAHPPKLTWKDVYAEKWPGGNCGNALTRTQELCAEVARLRNAAREDGWIEEAARIIASDRPTDGSTTVIRAMQYETIIRATHYARDEAQK